MTTRVVEAPWPMPPELPCHYGDIITRHLVCLPTGFVPGALLPSGGEGCGQRTLWGGGKGLIDDK